MKILGARAESWVLCGIALAILLTSYRGPLG